MIDDTDLIKALFRRRILGLAADIPHVGPAWTNAERSGDTPSPLCGSNSDRRRGGQTDEKWPNGTERQSCCAWTSLCRCAWGCGSWRFPGAASNGAVTQLKAMPKRAKACARRAFDGRGTSTPAVALLKTRPTRRSWYDRGIGRSDGE